MAVLKAKYGTATAVTITLTSLADGSAQQSTEIDNSTDLFTNALLRIKTNGQAGGTGRLEVYVFSQLGDAIRSGGAGATDAAFTGKVEELRFLGTVQMNAATAVTVVLDDVASAFAGVLPQKWGIVILNKSDAALSATAGDHDIDYQGYNIETV